MLYGLFLEQEGLCRGGRLGARLVAPFLVEPSGSDAKVLFCSAADSWPRQLSPAKAKSTWHWVHEALQDMERRAWRRACRTNPLALQRVRTTSPAPDCRRLVRKAGQTRVPSRAIYETASEGASPASTVRQGRRHPSRQAGGGGRCSASTSGGGPPRAETRMDLQKVGQMVERLKSGHTFPSLRKSPGKLSGQPGSDACLLPSGATWKNKGALPRRRQGKQESPETPSTRPARCVGLLYSVLCIKLKHVPRLSTSIQCTRKPL